MINAYPSSFATSIMVWYVLLYLREQVRPGWGPCIRLLATSKGMLNIEAKVPAKKPMARRRTMSSFGS